MWRGVSRGVGTLMNHTFVISFCHAQWGLSPKGTLERLWNVPQNCHIKGEEAGALTFPLLSLTGRRTLLGYQSPAWGLPAGGPSPLPQPSPTQGGKGQRCRKLWGTSCFGQAQEMGVVVRIEGRCPSHHASVQWESRVGQLSPGCGLGSRVLRRPLSLQARRSHVCSPPASSLDKNAGTGRSRE